LRGGTWSSALILRSTLDPKLVSRDEPVVLPHHGTGKFLSGLTDRTWTMLSEFDLRLHPIDGVCLSRTAGLTALDTSGFTPSDVFTLLLVIATFVLALATFGIVLETRRARLADYQPIIKAGLGWIGPIAVSLKIQNVGKGVAKNIQLEIQQLPAKDPARKWVSPILPPNEFARLPLKPHYIKELASAFDKITLKGKCTDALGQPHAIEDSIDLKEILNAVEASPWLLEYPLDERVGEIDKSLKEVLRTLDEIAKQMQSGIVIKTPKDVEKEYKKTLKEREARTKQEKPKA